MRQLSFTALALALWISTAWATPLTYSLDGTLADGGTISGTVTADLNQVAGVDVRGWANTTYSILGVDVTIHPTWSILLGTVHYTDPASAEWCSGICTFGGAPATSLHFADGLNVLQMSWAPDGALTPSTVKIMLADQSTPGLQGMELIRSGSLAPVAVPEAPMWVMVGLGAVVVAIVGWMYGKDVRHV